MTNQNIPTDIFCNPLPMPDYPTGICAPSRIGESAKKDNYFIGPVRDYRELADPEGLYLDGKWYVFPSARQAYVSSDLAHWDYCPLTFEADSPDLGYAPSIAKVKDHFILTSSVLFRGKPAIFTAPSPLGPYRNIGGPQMPDGSPIQPAWLDPTIFCDEDGRLYMYWHYAGADDGIGIYGAEFDPENPTHAITQPVKIIDFDSSNEFERYGENNEHTGMSYIEGEAMFKINGEYYFQYACNGTVFRHYAVGVYRGKSPMGPFTVQRTPVAISPYGRVTGTGHGSWMAGPNGTIWQFYTCCARRVHFFERRIGVDKVVFDANGDAHAIITSTPQSMTQGDLGWKPVSVNKPTCSSSYKDTNYAPFASDDMTHTWWMPAANDTAPWLEIDLKQTFNLNAVQIQWIEEGLDFNNGVLPKPVPFELEFYDASHALIGKRSWKDLQTDHLIEFKTFEQISARQVRLTFENPANSPLKHGVACFTLFGNVVE